jgi:hypothetical protein
MSGLPRQAHEFPILNEGCLEKASKALRRTAIQRMRTSPRSEDWVTWNMLQPLLTPSDEHGGRVLDRDAWQHIVSLAGRCAPGVPQAGLDAPPRVKFWLRRASPPAYEAARRERMRKATEQRLRERAENARPVEGPSEIDVAFIGKDYLIFAEAKLTSDIADGTTYDPTRNQIVRNIDCLLEECGDRQPLFWMFAKDRAPSRKYVAKMDQYRKNALDLSAALPHRGEPDLCRVGGGLAIILWQEIFALVADRAYPDPAWEEVRAELRRRVH